MILSIFISNRIGAIKKVSYFFLFQFGIQFIEALSGILIVRNLLKSEYAYFGVASNFGASILNLSIAGAGSFLISKGVKENDSHIFSLLVANVNDFIRRNRIYIFILSIPLIFLILNQNNLSVHQILFFIVLIGLDSWIRIRNAIYQNILNVHEKYNYLQKIAFLSGILRLLLIVVFLKYLNASIVYCTLIISYLLQFFIYKKAVSKIVFSNSVKKADNTAKELKRVYISQLPQALYTYLDTHFFIYILSVFGGVSLIADFNASGRLSLIVVAFNAFLNNVLVVKFAKISDTERLRIILLKSSLLLFIIYGICIAISIYFPHLFILLIGEQYSNISDYLYLTVICICLGNYSSYIIGINYSKMWILKNWIAIPITVAIQIPWLIFFTPTTFNAVWIYCLISALPMLIVNLVICIKNVFKFNDVTIAK